MYALLIGYGQFLFAVHEEICYSNCKVIVVHLTDNPDDQVVRYWKLHQEVLLLHFDFFAMFLQRHSIRLKKGR